MRTDRQITRSVTVLATLGIILILPAAVAEGFLIPVGGSDSEVGRKLLSVRAVIGFADHDGDGSPDYSSPDEPFYIDVRGDDVVNFGDVRITPAGSQVAGSVVNSMNWDAGMRFYRINGWYSQSATGQWYIDTFLDNRVSVGDVAIPSTGPPTKVAPADPALGQTLNVFQQTITATERVGFIDANGDFVWTIGEPLFLDNGNHEVNAGDLRLGIGELAPDDWADAAASRQRVEDLEARVSAMEHAAVAAPQAAPDLAGEVAELRREVATLAERLATLEREGAQQDDLADSADLDADSSSSNTSAAPAVLAAIALGVAAMLVVPNRRRQG